MGHGIISRQYEAVKSYPLWIQYDVGNDTLLNILIGLFKMLFIPHIRKLFMYKKLIYCFFNPV